MAESPKTGRSKDLQRLNHELSVLNAIARELNRSVDLGETLEFTLSQVAELLDLRTGWVWLISEESSEPYLAASQNLPPALANDPRRMDGSGYCYCLDTYKKGDLEGAANVNVLACSRLNARSTRLGAVEERNRLAREIHDTLAQGLTAAALQLESADALLDAGSSPERAREPLRRALALTQSNLEEARRSVLDLRAAPLEGRSLSEALEILVERWEAETRIGARYR